MSGETIKPFGKAVADVYRDLKKGVENRPVMDTASTTGQPMGAIDKSVQEQVISDLDGLIKKNDG